MSKRSQARRGPWTLALASQIRAERSARRLTMDQVAELSGIPRTTYVRIEYAETDIDADQMWRLARAYDLRVSELSRRAEERMADMDNHEAEAEQALSQMSPLARQKARETLEAIRDPRDNEEEDSSRRALT